MIIHMTEQTKNILVTAAGFGIAGLIIVGTVWNVTWLLSICFTIAGVLMLLMAWLCVQSFYSIAFREPHAAKARLAEKQQPAWLYYVLVVYYALYGVVLFPAGAYVLYLTLTGSI
jgi:hypothetical protein